MIVLKVLLHKKEAVEQLVKNLQKLSMIAGPYIKENFSCDRHAHVTINYSLSSRLVGSIIALKCFDNKLADPLDRVK